MVKAIARTENRNTVHITVRAQQHIAETLEQKTKNLNMSASQLHNSILQKWVEWDNDAQDLGLVPAPKEILVEILSCMKEDSIQRIVTRTVKFFKDAVIMMEGGYDLKKCIVALEKYMRATGTASNHTITKGGIHYFTVRHGMWVSWSMFIESVLRRLFSEFVPNQKIGFEMSEGTMVCKIDLGSDWNEHDY